MDNSQDIDSVIDDLNSLDTEEATLNILRRQLASINSVRIENQRKDTHIAFLTERVKDLESEVLKNKTYIAKIAELEKQNYQLIQTKYNFNVLETQLKESSDKNSNLQVEILKLKDDIEGKNKKYLIFISTFIYDNLFFSNFIIELFFLIKANLFRK